MGIFCDVNSAEFFIIAGVRAAPYPSPYINSHNESRTRDHDMYDTEWHLDQERYSKLNELFINNAILHWIIA